MLVTDSYLKLPKWNTKSSSSIFMSQRGRNIETYHSNPIEIACLQLLALIYFFFSVSAVLLFDFFFFFFASTSFPYYKLLNIYPIKYF